MREELLFRAKRLDTKKWVYGYYTQTPAVDIRDLAVTGDPMPDTIADCITTLKAKRYRDRASGQTLATIVQVTYRVDPRTVCRYTGKRDTAGHRIFENDFIRCTRQGGGLYYDALSKWGLVQERHGAFGIMQNYPRYEPWRIPYVFRPFKGWLEDYDYEILGNKYDNPTMWARYTKAGGPALRYE